MSIESIGMQENRILGDMQAMANVASNGASNRQINAASGASFSDAIVNHLNNVNQLQLESSATRKAFVQGDPNVSLADVIATSSKSSVAFEAVRQTHTKVFEAYKDILSLQL